MISVAGKARQTREGAHIMEALVHPQLIMLNCMATGKNSVQPGLRLHSPGCSCIMIVRRVL